MKNIIVTILTLISLSMTAEYAAFHVSPSGTGDYSKASPGPLSGVLAKVRSVNSAMTGDINIYFHQGTYILDSSLVLTSAESGKNGFSIGFLAFPGEKPILSGGKPITGWALFDSTKNIFRANVGSDLRFRQLYVNGVRAIRARSGFNPSGFTITGSGFTTTDTSMQHWKNASDIEIVSFKEWKSFRGGVNSISGGAITMKQPYWGLTMVHSKNYGPDRVTWVENAIELLDSPGEWYFDKTTGYLYYKPRARENMSTAEVIVPLLQTLVLGKGTLAAPVQNIRFSGLTFSHATWMKPSSDTGYAALQSGTYTNTQSMLFKKMPANLTFHTANKIAFVKNTFIHLGASAIDFDSGSSYNQFTGNYLTDISGNGIQFGGIEDSLPTDPLVCRGNSIRNNLIEDIGAEYHSTVPIIGFFVDSTLIEHNELFNLPYAGISVGWRWNPQPTSAKNNKIRFNYVHDYMQKLRDGGGVYTLGAQPGTEVSNNYLKNQKNENGMLYPDEGSSYMHWHHNVTESGTRWLHMWKSDIQYDTVEFNYHDNNIETLNGTNNILRNNVLITGGNWPPEAIAIKNGAGLESDYSDIRPIVPPAPSKLLLRLAFDETSGLKAADSSGNGFDGAFTAGAWASGRIGNALQLDGAHSVSIPGPSGPMQSFTVSFWIYPTALADYNQGIGPGWGKFIFHSTANGAVYCGTDMGTRFSPTDLPAGTIELNKWQHIAYTFENNNAVFYKNGKRLAGKTQNQGQDWTGFSISSVNGSIDELLIYDAALDTTSVSTLAKGEKLIPVAATQKTKAVQFHFRVVKSASQSALISYQVKKSGSQVAMAVYSASGEVIAHLVNEKKAAGTYRLTWNMANLPGGIYFFRFRGEGIQSVQRLVLIK